MPTENNQQNSMRVDYADMVAWLNKKWGNQECPICHEHSWNIEQTAIRGDRFVFTGQPSNDVPFMVFIPVTCTNCGYTLLFNNERIRAVKLYPQADTQ
ncbi:zinc ribbon domain-containing protein [Bifidobacterium sp. SO4]|uniref:zinc ribbon domain-containing protein n=1 Tax=Bifidobacterium sp. SO4 TaxID=2809030 RepID=UPI001BDBD0E7|nr:zinc ribbon domain-containing protein [Bifidobacterium sp. SO4]MBT1171289.1 hypothetical protein [Bifidobacterium sp. SO4]